MMSHVQALLCLGAVLGNCAAVKEYVALGPSSGSLQWVEVEYEEGVSSAKDVSLSPVTSAPSELDAWYGLDTGGLALTAKIVGDNMYALYENSKSDASGGGCCADTLKIYARSGGDPTTLDLNTLVQGALGTTDAHVSHTFDVSYMADDANTLAAIFQVKYIEASLGNVYADALVAVDISAGSVIQTADGDGAFNMYEKAGTTDKRSEQSRFKIQYFETDSTRSVEEFHGNGVNRFTSTDGISYVAFTHRVDAEAVIFKDPFTYSSTNGGGLIVQRFGTPSLYSSSGSARSTRYFGLDSSASYFDSGVHNVFYTASSKSTSLAGKETISMFVNEQDGNSAAYEFVFNPVVEGSDADTGDDLVFNVDYVFAKCSFTAKAQGGARSIGNGVFLVSSGADATGLEVTDSSGNTRSQSYLLSDGTADTSAQGFYDPFIRVVVDSSSTATLTSTDSSSSSGSPAFGSAAPLHFLGRKGNATASR